MTSPQKPKLLRLKVDSGSRRKVLKGVPILAITVAITFIGGGAIFAQTQEVIVANTSGNVAALDTPQQNSTVTPPILNFPSAGTLSDDEGFLDSHGFSYFDDEDDEDDYEDDEED